MAGILDRDHSRSRARLRRWSAGVLLIPIVVAACGEASERGPDLVIREARVRPVAVPEEGGAEVHSAAYLTIRNRGGVDDRLLGAGFSGARRVEIHETRVSAEGLATMRPVESITIPAGAEIRLEPGGLHVMLMGLESSLVSGDTVRLSLEFDKSGTRTVPAEVGE